jgi:hypothetical protein
MLPVVRANSRTVAIKQIAAPGHLQNLPTSVIRTIAAILNTWNSETVFWLPHGNGVKGWTRTSAPICRSYAGYHAFSHDESPCILVGSIPLPRIEAVCVNLEYEISGVDTPVFAEHISGQM